ncbi:kelch-like protein [Pyxidicoccus parkwayensis]|uniref:Kelch-like protein n=1 Tax=Pyxidicoccus parkwayensis TaxID=2813578 RepID=A0ABX7NWZ9_9BACT|nr:kelch motif-containing protein [Pyxidicoccus parkwaysis]QSQ23238.1 kelch-like protein [Pyxidicoccus parkwaysis]
MKSLSTGCRLAFLAIPLLFAVAGCRSGGTEPEPEPGGSVQLVAFPWKMGAMSEVAHVSVTRTAVDGSSSTLELVKANGVWSGTLGHLPVGASQGFVAQAFDASGAVLFEGRVSDITVTADQTPLVALTLQEPGSPAPVADEAPVIDAVVASALSVRAGGTVSLRAIAHAANLEDTVVPAWTATSGSFADAANVSTEWAASESPGLVTLTVTVRDSTGATSSVSLSVDVSSEAPIGGAPSDVRFNVWPQVSVPDASATRVEVGQSVTFSASAIDRDGDALESRWTATCVGTWTDSTSSTAAFTPTVIPAKACDNCRVELTVSDGRGGETVRTLSLCVVPAAPVVVSSNASSRTAGASQQLTFEVVARDPHGGTLTFNKWWASNGTLSPAQNEATRSQVTWTAPACKNAEVDQTVVATITNDLGLSTMHRFSVSVDGLPACGPGWAPAGNMAAGRNGPEVILLPNGKVFVAGGSHGRPYAPVEVYDPATDSWDATATSGGLLNAPMALLPSGKFLSPGGFDGIRPLDLVQMYDPVTNVWSLAQSMRMPRYAPTATRLLNGKVFVAGGECRECAIADVYDPTLEAWYSVCTLAGLRHSHVATLLPDGRVLLSGGYAESNAADLYTPSPGYCAPTGPMAVSHRVEHATALLPGGKVLAVGGSGATAEEYDPATNTWTLVGSMATPREGLTATALPNGKVLVTGGRPSPTSSATLATAELYDPVTRTWSSAGSMAAPRKGHKATLLPNGRVLIIGGLSGSPGPSAELYIP